MVSGTSNFAAVFMLFFFLFSFVVVVLLLSANNYVELYVTGICFRLFQLYVLLMLPRKIRKRDIGQLEICNYS